MSIDRSKFKKTSVSQMTQADKQLNQQLGKKERTNGHDIDEGINLFRVYPVHPDTPNPETDLFAHPYAQVYIPAYVQEKKDGQVVIEGGKPKMRLSSRPVWNAVVHGGKKMENKKDLILAFIEAAKSVAAKRKLSGDAWKAYMKPIYGLYNSTDPKKSVQGINYGTAWVLYADKYPGGNPSATPVFDELIIKPSIKNRLNAISNIEANGDPLGTDPFTDIEEGRAVRILKDKDAGDPKNIYTTELDSSTETIMHGGKAVKIQKTFPLTDEQLEAFMKMKPLASKYGVNVVTRKNFEAQLAGLQIIDDQYKMGIFELPEWEEVVVEIDSYYPDVDEVPNDVPAEEPVEEVYETPEVDSDEFDLMDRAELKAFAKDNKTGILLKPTQSDDDVRLLLRNWKANAIIVSKPLPTDADCVAQPEVKSEPVAQQKETSADKQAFLDDLNGVKAEEKTEPAATTNISPADKLAAIRAKMKNKTAA